MGGKWLELLKEMAPRVNRAAMIFNPDTAPGAWHTAASAIRRASMSRSIVELSAQRTDAAKPRSGREQGTRLHPEGSGGRPRSSTLEVARKMAKPLAGREKSPILGSFCQNPLVGCIQISLQSTVGEIPHRS
jgi:hypothetical protein